MRYVAAYLLAALGGKDSPSASDLEKILSSVGIEADGEKLKIVIGQLKGKNIDEVIAAARGGADWSAVWCAGREKLASMPAAGGAAAPAAAASGPAAAAAAAPEKEEKKPEKKEESESEDDDMGFGLFD
ncbi:large ribosomal subunit protein P2 isoform X1 [Bacillus rossius redtenbacheri]|uniref:large ribosomal subunit protein P2 isoform X1 n=1 Tax=Bacillus rossius redtenbacheri TaxID=93214 RepID=UPI002FDE7120